MTSETVEKPRVLPAPPASRLLEVKEKLSGEELRFDLERWLLTPDLAVGRWLAETDNLSGVPAGTYSWGVWWAGRPIGVYRLHSPEGELLCYRIDAIEELRIGEGKIHYRDLLLDARIQPDGAVSFEDEDEVEEAIVAARLSWEQRWRIDWMRGVIANRPVEVRSWVDGAIERAVTEVAG